MPQLNDIYSIVIAVHPESESPSQPGQDWRLGEITVDWMDFTREKSIDIEARSPPQSAWHPPAAPRTSVSGRAVPGAMSTSASTSSPQGANGASHASPSPSPASASASTSRPSASTSKPRRKKRPESADTLSLQPLLAHIPGPVPVDASAASGVTHVGNGVVHLFRHAPPPTLVARLEGQNGESSAARNRAHDREGWAGDRAEGEDGSLVAILAVPAWMRPADLLEFLGGWVTCLEGVRMIREATTPNRSIVLLKFRDPLQASDFMVIFTGRAFSTLDARETCHPIQIHHLVLHKLEDGKASGGGDVPIPAFPPSVYASRARQLPELLTGVPKERRYEMPSCPVCLERLDSTVTGLVTLPCAHTFDCDCLRKWGDSRCPVCRVSHLLLSTANKPPTQPRDEITRASQCGMCDSTENNWMCVVCGAVGCGRYSKGHARRHWKESGHVLAMELETQRVWDYQGDNYVHRLIQTRTDGKLVELPSASSLVTAPARTLPLNRPLSCTPPPGSAPGSVPGSPTPHPGATVNATPPPRATPPPHGHRHTPRSHERRDSGGVGDVDGPSSNDMEKMSTIEAITLEYSYLLSSQLEAMRQHYEAEASAQRARIAALESEATRVREIEAQISAAEARRTEAERERERAEKRADKALDLSRSLQASLGSERAMTSGLTARITKLREDVEAARRQRDEKDAEVKSLEETVRDLMFTLEAGIKIQETGGEGEGGDLVVVGGDKKKKKKK